MATNIISSKKKTVRNTNITMISHLYNSNHFDIVLDFFSQLGNDCFAYLNTTPELPLQKHIGT